MSDGKTLAPNKRKRNHAGRPRVKRIRRRSKYEKPEESIIKCKYCNANGHNIRTCAKRKAIAEAAREAHNNNLDPEDVAAVIDPGFERNMM